MLRLLTLHLLPLRIEHPLDLVRQYFSLALEVLALVRQLVEFQLHFCCFLLRLQRFPDSVGHAALIQRLIRLNRHLDLVFHAHEQESPLGTVDRRLPDELVERLRVELLAQGADSGLARLALLELLVELFLEVDHVEAGGRRGADVLDP